MHPSSSWTDRRRDILQKSDDVMIRAFFNLGDFNYRKPALRTNNLRIGPRNQAQISHRFAGQSFDLKPNRELPLFRPDIPHLRARVTRDHALSVR